MTPLLLLTLAVTPWTITESPPKHLELFETKPVPAKNVFGKVLPSLANVGAFAKSKPSVVPVEPFARLAELAAAAKPEQVSITLVKPRQEPELPALFIDLADVSSAPSTKSVERRVMSAANCADDEDCKPDDHGVSIEQPVRVLRDEQKRIRALAFRTEQHVTWDTHDAKKVTVRNAREHTFTQELLEFDESGRLVRSARWSRTDNEMRYLPGIDVQVWTYEWKDGALTQAIGTLITEDSEALDLVVRQKTFSAPAPAVK